MLAQHQEKKKFTLPHCWYVPAFPLRQFAVQKGCIRAAQVKGYKKAEQRFPDREDHARLR